MNTTLHDLLTQMGYPWDAGTLILHRTGTVSPGWANPNDVDQRRSCTRRTPAIHVPFNTRAGTPEMPRFIAFAPGDSGGTEVFLRVWIPYYDDVNTGIMSINLDPLYYLSQRSMTPYPGGT